MKAIVIDRFGGPEELKQQEVPTPKPGPGEILVKIHYAGVNPVDWKIREGHLASVLPHHFPLIPGWDAAGEVVENGEGATRFRPGDRVFAYCRKPEVQWGTYAELITLPESTVASIPRRLSYKEAAAVPLTALTAWQSLHDFAQIQKGQAVLVLAGAGGVGGFALQFAKLVGCRVLTTARLEKHAYVRALGADVVIDYTTQNVRAVVRDLAPHGVDVVFDLVGGKTQSESYQLLKPGGTLVSIVDAPKPEEAQAHHARAGYVFVSPNGPQLAEIARLYEEGDLEVPQLQVFPLAQAAEAHRQSETHRTVGKLVLEI